MRVNIFLFLLLSLAACQLNAPTPTPAPTTIPTETPTPVIEVAPSPTATLQVTSEPTTVIEVAAPEPTATRPTTLASAITLVQVADGFTKPVYLTHAQDERLFVVEQPGNIAMITNGARQAASFLNLEDRVGSSASEQGLLAVAFHPEFRTNQRLFVYYTNKSGNVVISEFTANSDLLSADPNSERILLTVAQPYRNHNGGALEFGPDGYLYIGLGDGGSAADPDYNGLDLSTLLGSILRIDVNHSEPYEIPPNNPFLENEAARNEIWAYGLRNPWRISFDSVTNDLFIADVGQNEWEEVSWQSAESIGGENYGWNAWEGSHCFTDECNSLTNTVQPIIEYNHDEGCSITGGSVYRGSQSPALYGNYIYGDFCKGTIWGAISAESGWQTRLLAETDLFISSFGVGVDGEVYVLDIDGVVYWVSAE